MDPRKYQFLVAVLGEDGARALRKATERSRECEAVLVPRAILAWLALTGGDGYEGDLPGIDNSYLAFAKSEDRFSGSVTMGDDVYKFESAPLLHLASAIAVAIGVDSDRLHPNLRDLDIVRLGKSIDLLAKARHVAERLVMEQDLIKAISLIPPGPRVREPRAATSAVFDYSHVLPERQRKFGYRIQVRHRPETGTVTAHVFKGPLEVGIVVGAHRAESLEIEDAEVQDEHQGKGLGTALYEALMAHAHHSGIKTVAGQVHSTMASGLHRKLSRKHGMEYRPASTPFPNLAARTVGPYDNRFGPYEYTIKDEIPANKGQGGANFWHLTTDPKFQIDATPRYEVAQDQYIPMLFLGQNPAKWHSWVTRENPGALLYAVRIQPSPSLKPGDTGLPEHMDYDPANAKILEMLPIHEAVRKYPNDFRGLDLDKAEPPGPAHAPTPPQDQLQPAPPTVQTQKGPKLPPRPKLPKVAKTLKITKSQSERRCGLCGLPQFKGDSFRGCLCFRDLAKHAASDLDEDGYTIRFRAEWDEDAVATLLEALGN